MTRFEFLLYDSDHNSMAIGLVMIVIGLFGMFMAYKIRRQPMFRVKFAIVFSIPIFLGLTNIIPQLYILPEYRMLLMCAFAFMLSILYWREMCELSTSLGYHKRILVDCFDTMPDLVWMMDLDGKLTYTNYTARRKLFFCTEKEAFGRTVTDIAKMEVDKGEAYTFGDICEYSRKETILKDRPCRFLVFGTVKSKLLALQMYCTPVHTHNYDDNRVTGFVVSARDLTYDFLDHKKICKLINAEDWEGVKTFFKIHTQRHQFTGDEVIRMRGAGCTT